MSSKKRLSKLKRILAERKIDIAIISRLPNVRYLSGFTGTAGTLIVSSDKTILATDFRYSQQAEEEASDCEIVIYKKGFDDYLGSYLKKNRKVKIGFESDFVPFEQFRKWSSSLSAEHWVSLKQVVEKLRMIKDEGEIKKIKEAAEISDSAFDHVLGYIEPGMTEQEVALELEYFMRKRGAERFAFDLIVAGGKSSAMPHANTSWKKISNNTLLLIDIGAVYQGYCSDMTRTIFIGEPKNKEEQIYQTVFEAQEMALRRLKAGIEAKEIDKVAREIVKERGFEDCFGHNLGHGVGLEVHELPILGQSSNDVLDNGMVFTVEPGIYVSGTSGVRIEDMVYLENGKASVITKSPKHQIKL